jgi:hypothetical protein
MNASGYCLCGEVAFEHFGDFQKFFLCHCEYCRKGPGSAHATNLFGRGGALVWLRGQAKVSSFKLENTRHQRSFCLVCGSALPYTLSGSEVLVVPAGCLDTPVSLMPQAHLFVSSRANWDSALEAVPCFERFPS